MHPEQRRILIVEDEQAIADTLIYSLRTEGFNTEHRLLGQDGLAVIAGSHVNLLILDVGLPDINGFDLCRELRRTSDLPALFLTARGDEIDRIVSLERTADTYIKTLRASCGSCDRMLSRSVPIAALLFTRVPAMRIPLQVAAGYFFIVGFAGWFVLDAFVEEVKPGVRNTMEDTLVDSANLIAELMAPRMRGPSEQTECPADITEAFAA